MSDVGASNAARLAAAIKDTVLALARRAHPLITIIAAAAAVVVTSPTVLHCCCISEFR